MDQPSPTESAAKPRGSDRKVRKRGGTAGGKKLKKDNRRATGEQDPSQSGPRGSSDHGPARAEEGGSQEPMDDSSGDAPREDRSGPGRVDMNPDEQQHAQGGIAAQEPGCQPDRQ